MPLFRAAGAVGTEKTHEIQDNTIFKRLSVNRLSWLLYKYYDIIGLRLRKLETQITNSLPITGLLTFFKHDVYWKTNLSTCKRPRGPHSQRAGILVAGNWKPQDRSVQKTHLQFPYLWTGRVGSGRLSLKLIKYKLAELFWISSSTGSLEFLFFNTCQMIMRIPGKVTFATWGTIKPVKGR